MGVNSAIAGANKEFKPPAFQIIVLVSDTIDSSGTNGKHFPRHVTSNVPALVLQVSFRTILA